MSDSSRHSRESGNPEMGADAVGTPAVKAALTRVTLTLALSHEGRGDPLTAIRT